MANCDEAPSNHNAGDEAPRADLSRNCYHWRLEGDVEREEDQDKQGLQMSVDSWPLGTSYIGIALQVEIYSHPGNNTAKVRSVSFRRGSVRILDSSVTFSRCRQHIPPG